MQELILIGLEEVTSFAAPEELEIPVPLDVRVIEMIWSFDLETAVTCVTTNPNMLTIMADAHYSEQEEFSGILTASMYDFLDDIADDSGERVGAHYMRDGMDAPILLVNEVDAYHVRRKVMRKDLRAGDELRLKIQMDGLGDSGAINGGSLWVLWMVKCLVKC